MQISLLLGDLLTRLRAELEPAEQRPEMIRSTADVA